MRKSEVRFPRSRAVLIAAFLLLATVAPAPARADTFPQGSLIIPMDLTYQDYGMLQAYGLVYQLLRHGIPVYWIISPYKVSSLECDQSPQGCWWDCAEQGSGEACPYLTFSPDLTLAARVLYDDSGLWAPGTDLPVHGYRGGPFVVHADDAAAALLVVEAWNTPDSWSVNPWAARTVFQVVTVHEAPAEFIATVGDTLRQAPRPAILADSREALFAGILRAAGVPQSDGSEFSDAPCEPGGCGPGTSRPDFIPMSLFSSVSGTCLEDDPSMAGTVLLDPFGRARYSTLATAGFTVEQRESVMCEDGPCQQATGTCFTTPIVFHGHRALLHHTAFFMGGGSLFAMGESVYAVENSLPDTAMPMLDDRQTGHFLMGGIPFPACPCPEPGTHCVAAGCGFYYFDDAYDCCQPDDPMLRGAGVVSVPAPSAAFADAPRPDSRFLQFDGDLGGALGPLGLLGHELAEGTSRLRYPENWAGASPGGDLALWGEDTWYLADLSPSVDLPVSAHLDTQASRLFLNAMFMNHWIPPSAPPVLGVELVLTDPGCFAAPGPDGLEFELRFSSDSTAPAAEAELTLTLPEGVSVLQCEGDFAQAGAVLTWTFSALPPDQVLRCTFLIPSASVNGFVLSLRTIYDRFNPVPVDWSGEVGLDSAVFLDSDDDGVCDHADPEPFVPTICGDHDGDSRDDCWPDDDDNSCKNDCEEYEPPDSDGPGGCACAAGSRSAPGTGHGLPGLIVCFLFLVRATRRRKEAVDA